MAEAVPECKLTSKYLAPKIFAALFGAIAAHSVEDPATAMNTFVTTATAVDHECGLTLDDAPPGTFTPLQRATVMIENWCSDYMEKVKCELKMELRAEFEAKMETVRVEPVIEAPDKLSWY